MYENDSEIPVDVIEIQLRLLVEFEQNSGNYNRSFWIVDISPEIGLPDQTFFFNVR